MNTFAVTPYTGNQWPRVAPLVEAWPFKPLANHNGWSRTSVLDLTSTRIVKTLENVNTTSWLLSLDDRTCGFACLSMLPWDSEQLGISAAKIDYLVAQGSYDSQHRTKERLLEYLIIEARQRGVSHLSARVDASDISSLHALEQAGFITVDGILTFAIDLTRHISLKRDSDFTTRLATIGDAEKAAALARTAYIYDRFHSDPFIPKERADELHAAWLRNACRGRTGDAVIVAEDDRGLLGFVTCALQSDTVRTLGSLVGTIVLVASAKHARGRGVAYAITMAALEWFQQQHCEMVEVGTQLRNIPASCLYQKCGFHLVASGVSLRLLP